VKKFGSITLCVYDRAGACGGPFGWATDFAGFFNSREFRVEVLILCPGGQVNSRIATACKLAEIPFAVLDTEISACLEDQTEWILVQWALRPSCVFVANLVLPAFYAGRWIRLAGGCTVGVIHSNPDHDLFYGDLLRYFVGGPRQWRLDAVVAVSDYIARKAKERAPAGMFVATIPCGTSVPAMRALPPTRELRLLYCGRLTQEQKRIRDVTAALMDATEILGVRATFCGDGEERPWLEARLENQNRLQYVGNLPHPEVHRLMAQHHVIVLLSDYEGLPMALAEGMACGLVPVCLDEPSGVREVIRDGVNGCLVKNRGPAFISAIATLRNPEVWEPLSAEARKTVERFYSHPVVFARWRALIEELALAAQPRPQLLPRRINLRSARPVESFIGYPCCRPACREVVESRWRSAWMSFRKAARLRARLRALLRSQPGD
jgi:colanic acid/amylovoran biosynthesis glycosyltransferase